MSLRTEDYDYDLPEELIAQHPLDQRDESRLMVVDRKTGEIADRHFYDLLDYLEPGDVLVLNDTKVIPARIFGTKTTGAHVEFLLVKELQDDLWECMVRPGRRARVGARFDFGEGLEGEVVNVTPEGLRHVRFTYPGVFKEILAKIGETPLPPYIHERLEDKNRYQTVYASVDGSAAAPTAGLHFTPELLEKIKDQGVDIETITLHVGLGTFLPVSEELITDHKMHSEYFEISPESAERINRAREKGKRIIAVGTTSMRALESAADASGRIQPLCQETDIFIYPGVPIKAVDALITNFHLPRSTLLMLVSALYDREAVLEAYSHAVDEKYRFFSFGDAMLIV